MERLTRNTKQRTVILKKLREVTSHPTADEVYAMTRESLPRISLGTVYRNLELLTRQGDILCLENSGAQKRFDGNPMPHHHVRCSECGKIGDVHAPVQTPGIDGLQVKGFTLTGVSVLFEGVCDSCKM
ncbi:transcriptional repressor [Desulfovibrio sp. OttesenSCG-928-O18]|nr:transcriptional repressor [Desulfovibrio sp. OttesenSCG-928-O18]